MQTVQKDTLPVKERLILAGIREIEAHGLPALSLRRVASACGLSCAAPYKHFSDKHDFILAIIDYANQEWLRRGAAVEERFAGNTRQQLVELSMEHIRFLLENSHFRAVLMLPDDSLDPDQARRKAEISSGTKRLIHTYCQEVAMPEDVRIRKTFVVRSLIYGAALMLENGQLPNDESSFRLIAQVIDREFDLP